MGNLSHTVSGGIAHFRTPSKVPLTSLKCHFLPKQEGSGDPSPTNVRNIIGYASLNGKRSKKNILNKFVLSASTSDGITKTTTDNGVSVTGTAEKRTLVRLVSRDKLRISSGEKVTFSAYINGDISECENLYVGYYINATTWGGTIGVLSQSNEYKLTWIVPQAYSNAEFPNIDCYIYIPEGVTVDFELGVQGEFGEKATAYEPYVEEQIPFIFPSEGKNLFNVHACKPFNNKVTLTYDGDAITCANTNSYSVNVFREAYMQLPPGKYTISTSQYPDRNIPIYGSDDGVNWAWMATGLTPESLTRTFTTTKKYTQLWFSVAADETITIAPIQVEQGESATAYESYIYPVYGGYIDFVAGEIVKTHALISKRISDMDNHEDYPGWKNAGVRQYLISGLNGGQLGMVNIGDRYAVNTNGNNDILWLSKSYYGLTQSEWIEQYPNLIVQFIIPIAEPIHIPITPQAIKAYLDYNNFWSDINDITEVTYAVTESKDILTTRKKAMDFDIAHHKKAEWNQLVKDGNFTSRDHWLISANDYGTVSVNDNIAAWTSTNPELQYYYHTGLTNKQFYLNIPENHRVLVKATVRSSVSRTDSTHRVSIFGMINYENSYAYTQNDVQANTWTDLFGFIRDNRTEGKKITRFKVCYGGTVNDGTIPVGTVLEVKNFMAFDLTQMFGLGNEPLTVAEFEHICEINGIDLDTYQPYDEGSDRWLIIP